MKIYYYFNPVNKLFPEMTKLRQWVNRILKSKNNRILTLAMIHFWIWY